MKIFLFLLSLIAVSTLSAQDSWKVSLNGKQLLNTSTESEEKNMITIKASDLKKKKELYVIYKDQPKQKDWQRTIIVVGDKDQELLRQENNTLKIKNTSLLSLFNKSKTLRFYTISLPTDPAKRAAIRVRRVHLYTLVKT